MNSIRNGWVGGSNPGRLSLNWPASLATDSTHRYTARFPGVLRSPASPLLGGSMRNMPSEPHCCVLRSNISVLGRRGDYPCLLMLTHRLTGAIHESTLPLRTTMLGNVFIPSISSCIALWVAATVAVVSLAATGLCALLHGAGRLYCQGRGGA